MSMWIEVVALCCLIWCIAVILVCAIGCLQTYRHYSKPPPAPISLTLPLKDIPHVTIIRPVKGLEPCLYECLAATFRQTYPSSKLTVCFCVSSRSDPALPILERVISDFSEFDGKIFIEEEDPNLSGKDGRQHNLGPNPKIRNMSRAYREAKGDIVWIIDCNVWVSKSVAGLMVDRLCGFDPASRGRKYKFVHQLPLVVDITNSSIRAIEGKSFTEGSQKRQDPAVSTTKMTISNSGGLLDEMFLSTSHAKFYTAISTVAIAPCTVGKSNMFRRSHLNILTPTSDPSTRSSGIDYFSENICEDHLIGDLLWKTPVPESVRRKALQEGGSSCLDEKAKGISWGHHALVLAPPCIQPVARQTVSTYIARRARWLRVRKFTVPMATFVEPGTESLLCTLYCSFGLTTYPWCSEVLGISKSWPTFFSIWIMGAITWSVVDYWVWNMLQNWAGEVNEEYVPRFVGSASQRLRSSWISAWLGRELLALPIWTWAVLGGTTVVWRGRRFWVGMDMRVHEVDESPNKTSEILINKYANSSGTKQRND
ncbi:hypothetical protein MMC34_005289 [Xylographa carneopallida]|nr:hypothetical protein [Xylographa carneopallida]